MLINGQAFKPGQVVPEAEKLQKFRTLVSAGWLIKAKEVAPMPPASPPADVNSGTARSKLGHYSPSPNITQLDKKQCEDWITRQEVKKIQSNVTESKSKPKAKTVAKPKTKPAKK